jgi:eukaryotic translation initiation factor 2C
VRRLTFWVAFVRFLEADTSQRNYDPGPLIAALNLVLSMQASRTGVRVGKNRHFFTPEERNMIGPGVEAWRGFYSSIRPVYKNLMVNVNVCMTAFVEGRNLGDAIREFRYGSQGGFPDLKALFGKSNIKVRTLHNGYKKPLKSIGNKTAAQQTFLEDGNQTTVANWFRRSEFLFRFKEP